MTSTFEHRLDLDTERTEAAREAMVAKQLISKGIHDPGLLEAMRTVPRHHFVPRSQVEHAYEDRPLEIGCGQTISQPYMIATMLELLDLKGSERVLEIGTGSGYQTALLARLAAHVYTVELQAMLLEPAETRVAELELNNVTSFCGDGSEGWFEHAPYDRIVVAAAAPAVPKILRNQLADGGRMVIPVGERQMQTLLLIERVGDEFAESTHGTCLFVPLRGEAGWQDDV